jgi:formate hydrogenlyase subunit 6/NADH:ubiquinone oxidoreductase subunit I
VLQILRLIAGNLGRGPATIRLPGSVPVPPGFRGRVLLEPARCLACGLCAYVCVSDAITGREDGGGGYGWEYDPGRCAFCARCVDHCPGHALAMASEPTRPYLEPGELAVRERIAFPPCPDCGAPARPATPQLLGLAFEHPTEHTRELVRRCERCRRRRQQRGLAAAAGISPAGEGEPGKDGTR